ncbi:MAG: LysR substrate-binding domain-containing protein [Sphingobium sp.]
MAHLQDFKIELRQFGYIAALAETRSITTAARMLGMAQPSLSVAISRLEKSLGVTLVIRVGRGIEFTEAGAALAAYGDSILKSTETALHNIRQIGMQKSGPVSLGLPPTIARLLGVPLVETIRNEYPDIHLRINEATSSVILDNVENEQLDLGISYQGNDFDPFDTAPLLEERLFLIAAPDDWRKGENENGIAVEPVTVHEMADLPLVLPNRPNGLRTLLERVAKSQNLELRTEVELDSLQNAVAMATRASAYPILSHAAVLEEVRSKQLILVPIIEPEIRQTAYLARKRGRPISSASLVVEKFLTLILEEAIERYRLQARLLSPPRQDSEKS